MRSACCMYCTYSTSGSGMSYTTSPSQKAHSFWSFWRHFFLSSRIAPFQIYCENWLHCPLLIISIKPDCQSPVGEGGYRQNPQSCTPLQPISIRNFQRCLKNIWSSWTSSRRSHFGEGALESGQRLFMKIFLDLSVCVLRLSVGSLSLRPWLEEKDKIWWYSRRRAGLKIERDVLRQDKKGNRLGRENEEEGS